ncbi:unnamed protein product [Meloidogyne enterolobii]|uniref:Uncharacterized protein n=1 Tax=Meloidogyne enterolobii TaxID=390850 RepID=A0ACB1AL55_MELEN
MFKLFNFLISFNLFLLIYFYLILKISEGVLINNRNFGLRQRRQNAPFDELIYGALRLVRPLVGSAKSLANDVIVGQNNLNLPSKNSKEIQRLSSSRLREIEILGTGQEINEEILKAENNNNGNSGIDNIPQICQGNSRICKFVACAAHNFKHDSNFANIQLAAQLLSDKKMRRTIGSNPSAIKDACKEHGLNNGQCGFIVKAFQLIDKFMSTIEDNQENQKQINKMSDSVLVEENNEQELIKRLEEGIFEFRGNYLIFGNILFLMKNWMDGVINVSG